MPEPVWRPPRRIQTQTFIDLDDNTGSGHIVLRPPVPPMEKRTERVVPAKLVVHHNPDGSIMGIDVYWMPGQLNRPID